MYFVNGVHTLVLYKAQELQVMGNVTLCGHWRDNTFDHNLSYSSYIAVA